ncbi:MAG: tripartite tricarboxylate transporter substrate-binding protein [Beijerinckiaceae bacterium]
MRTIDTRTGGVTRRMALALAACAAAWPSAARAKPPIRIVTGFAAGGSSDGIAKIIAAKLQDLTGAPVEVENRTGSGGRLAVETVRAAPRDGGTILLANTSMMVLAPLMHADVSYDALRDFIPVAGVSEFYVALATGPMTAARSMPELLGWARLSRDRAKYGVPGIGSIPHIAGLQFQKVAGAPIEAIMLAGGAPIVEKLVAGHLAMGFASPADFMEHHDSGKLRIVAVTGPARYPLLPQIPTFAEFGLTGLEHNPWNALFLPAGTSAAITDRYRDLIARIIAMPDVRDALAARGNLTRYEEHDALAARIRSEKARYSQVIQTAGLGR